MWKLGSMDRGKKSHGEKIREQRIHRQEKNLEWFAILEHGARMEDYSLKPSNDPWSPTLPYNYPIPSIYMEWIVEKREWE